MNDVQIVCVRLDGSDNIYNFKNKHEFTIEVGDRVECKVGTGGVAKGTVVTVVSFDESLALYPAVKNIVEVFGLKTVQQELQDGFAYVCDIRIWRNQWSSDGGYDYQWSDLIVTCLYDESEYIKIGSIVKYQETDGKVVNLRQMPSKKTLKLEKVFLKAQAKKGFFARLFS